MTSTTHRPATAVLLCAISTSGAAEPQRDMPTVEVYGDAQNERLNHQEDLFNKPWSSHLVDQQQLREESIPDIAEALRDAPGVSVTEAGAFSKGIKIRGLQGARVVSLVDGIKLSNQGMTHTGAGETGMVDIANVRSIEAVKGSPSVVYDPGASGGVVNVKTLGAELEEGVGFSQRLGYDGGYEQSKSTTSVNASNGRLAARFTYAEGESRDYNIRDQDGKKFAISKANFDNSLSSNYIETHNLGYRAESTSVRLSAKAGEDGVFSLDWDDWVGKDMSLIHGPAIRDATIIQYDRMERDFTALSYRKDRLGAFNNFNAKFARQTQFQAIGAHAQGVTLESDQLNLVADYTSGDWLTLFGAELIADQAETLVYSEQDYIGVFANVEYVRDQWTLFGGARWNDWVTRQKLLSDANAEVAQQLLGISGITPSLSEREPTVALGAQYVINDFQNISINANTTFRNPDLMERYAFSGTVGGGQALKPEQGKHLELAWKYLSGSLFMSGSVFYSDFDDYIWTKEKRNLTNPDGLVTCIRLGKCDPEIGDFNGQDSEFFEIYNVYYNAEQVTNRGAEFTLQHTVPRHDTTFTVSFNDIKSQDTFVRSAAHPIDVNLAYRYQHDHPWQPWVKVKTQYVFDEPKVKQHMGFDPYFLASLHAGIRKGHWIMSLGVRNIFNETYRAPYSGINGLERSAFINIAYDFQSSKKRL